MAYITLGTASQLTIKVPTIGSTDWGDTMRTDTFLKIAEHDHTGSGSGTALSTGSIAADAITGTKIRLDNNEYIRARNAANSGDIDTIKIGTNDKLSISPEISTVVKLSNNISLQHRNGANSSYINTLLVNGLDQIEFGTNILSANLLTANITTTNTSLVTPLTSAITLADNQTAITAGVVTLAPTEACSVHYRIVRNSVIQSGVLKFNYGDTIPSESFHGTDVGVTFTVSTGTLNYATTSTGFTGSMTYIVIKG